MRFEPKRLIRISDSSILEEIQRVVKENGGVVPTIKEFSQLARISIATPRDRFGSYAAAIERAGFSYTPQSAKFTAENIVADLRNILKEAGGIRFSYAHYKQYGGLYALATIWKCLGVNRWDDVMAVIGGKAPQRQIQVRRQTHRQRRREDLTDDDLLNEIGRVWKDKGRRPTSVEFDKESKVGSEPYRHRFGSWTKAIEHYCKKMGVRFQQQSRTRVTKVMLLAELREVCGKRPSDLITYEMYKQRGGTYSIGAFFNHFGTWTKAVNAIGSKSGDERKYSTDELFDEMQRLWEDLEQQPTWHEMRAMGNISPKVYARAFGSWKKAVTAFCDDRNSGSDQPSLGVTSVEAASVQHESGILRQHAPTVMATESVQTALVESPTSGLSASVRQHPRRPSPKVRFLVFKRDNFSCQFCGRSHKRDGVRMVVDHIFPWEKGGPTILVNLQLLCEDCNLGKSNLLIS